MALKSTIFKALLSVSDLDRHYYAEHALTLARHPSETDERMMVRLAAFALFADERLEFGKGLSTEDEAALILREYDGSIRLWIEVGLPDERVLRKASGRAERVILLAYGGRAVDVWWAAQRSALARLGNLEVRVIPADASSALAAMAQRGMQLQATLQDATLWLNSGGVSLELPPQWLMGGP